MRDWLPIVAAGMLFAAIWGHGYQHGQAVAQAAHMRAVAAQQSDMAQLRRTVAVREGQRMAAERQINELREQLDAKSRTDPDAERRAFSADSMRRIGQIGAGDN